jgi:hypothetical protein
MKLLLLEDIAKKELDFPLNSGILELGRGNMTQVKTLKSQLCNMNTQAALVCLSQTEAAKKLFYWSGQMWTPAQALAEWDTSLQSMKSGKFGVVRFYGGPPTKCDWYDGTILSMLCDTMLFDEHTKDWSTKEILASYV